MTNRQLSSVSALPVLASIWALMSAPAFTQTKTSSAPPLVITAFGGQTPKVPYKSPKTPWGEPDLVGVWSTDDTANIPMARPAQFGDRLFLTPEEFANREKQVERAAKQ